MVKRRNRTAIPGRFQLPNGQQLEGQLELRGRTTSLRVHSETFIEPINRGTRILCDAHNGDRVTLLDCQTPGAGHPSLFDGRTKYYADIFPHFVAVGHSYLDHQRACVAAIQFVTTDLHSIFCDFDAFGSIHDASPEIFDLVQSQQPDRKIEIGEWPEIFYFTGKTCISAVETAIGKISAFHALRRRVGGSRGFTLLNRVAISIEFKQPLTFAVAMQNLSDLRMFLSVVAGRAQGIEQIEVVTDEIVDGHPARLHIHPSFRWKCSRTTKNSRPRPRDIPLDPVGLGSEYSRVLTAWVENHEERRIARARYMDCLRRSNQYGAERLIAAANVFELLPPSAYPKAQIPDERLRAAREAATAMFRALPPGIDRSSVLSSLGRIGQLSLPKKVACRVQIVEKGFGARFPDLAPIANLAIRARNSLVHGGSNDFDIGAAERFFPFLTDVLEFVFGASELIESGWTPEHWLKQPKGWGHGFARMLWSYEVPLQAIREANLL